MGGLREGSRPASRSSNCVLVSVLSLESRVLRASLAFATTSVPLFDSQNALSLTETVLAISTRAAAAIAKTHLHSRKRW